MITRCRLRNCPRRPTLRTLRVRLLMVGLVSLTVLTAVGCGDGAAGDSNQQLDAVADRIVAATLALKLPGTSAGSLELVPTATSQAGGKVMIGNTSGTGVALRSDCLDEARSVGAWADATAMVMVEYGADRCAGWSRVVSGGTTSWVRNEYLIGLTASPLAAGAAAPNPREALLRPWVAALMETAWRVAVLVRSTPGRNDGVMAVTYLGNAASDARALAVKVEAAAPSIPANCAPARRELLNAAGDLETLATVAQRFFESPGPDGVSSVESAAETYIGAQTAMAGAVNACLSG